MFAEILCEPDGSAPTVASTHYEFDGECIAFEEFDAGTLGDVPIRYPVSVHGPVIGTATSEGVPVALTSQRSTFGRDGLNLGALKDMTEGDADTTEAFFETANQFGFTFNWGYANRDSIGYFASGLLPVRAEGLDRRLPTLGTGEYEWQGFLEQDEHPHASGHPTDRLLNWNNQSAPGFMHGDNNQYGSVHRVEAFDQWPDEAELTDVVGVMNRSATEDVRSTVWPVISEVLAGGDAPSELAARGRDHPRRVGRRRRPPPRRRRRRRPRQPGPADLRRGVRPGDACSCRACARTTAHRPGRGGRRGRDQLPGDQRRELGRQGPSGAARSAGRGTVPGRPTAVPATSTRVAMRSGPPSTPPRPRSPPNVATIRRPG